MAATQLSLNVGRAFYGRFRQLRRAQRETIAPVVAGHDVLVLARTGSGKTEAVIAPLVQRWLSERRDKSGCTLLYVTPTRALANDLLRRIEPPMEALGLTVGIRHGERNDLCRTEKPSLLITTPESLDVLVTGRNDALCGARAVVLDEIHLTYNTQRGFQIASLLRRLETFIGNGCQVVGLSATVAAPSDIWAFFRPGHDVVTVHDDEAKPLDALIRHLPSDQALIHLFNALSTDTRLKVLLFANTRRECDRLGAMLTGNTGFGQNVFVHHSSLEREVRLNAERAFQEATKAVCVATSTLELGIDIGDIGLVVLYGHPGGWESFLQRVGRGNRRSSKTNVLCLVSPDHGSRFRNILAFEALLSQIRTCRLERERPLDIYGAAAQQLLSGIAERNGNYVRALDLAALFSPWPYLNASVVDSLLHHFTESGHLRRHDFKNRFGPGEQLHRLRDLHLIWGNFPARSRDIQVLVGDRQIGNVPAVNLIKLSRGSIIRFAGRYWRVSRLSPDHIDVEPSESTAGMEVSYGGSAGRIDPTIVEEMLRLIAEGVKSPALAGDAQQDVLALADCMRRYIGWDRLPVARDEDGNLYYFTFGGRLLNDVIARWAGLDEYEAGEIALRTRRALDFSALPSDAEAMADFAPLAMQLPADLTVFQALLPADMLQRELADIWVKTAVNQRSIERLRRSQFIAAPFEVLAPLL